MHNLKEAQTFCSLTEPDILCHMSCTPEEDKGSTLSL